MIIMQVINKVFIVFSSKEIVLETNASQYLHPLEEQDIYGGRIYFFQFQYRQTLKFVYPFFIGDN